ncbi:hypothetical protein CHH28_17380 [Bacterioplanes sanyensis]|uniref:Uncharacterized protein n=1 Tax=Bacterioplanes sanyensis TaxID=1249553 RepID=A0A222FNK5_9GAMM|nr:hypothetical protein [Bacterioplanes sanyensis]ASP40339.1 hypothetical protein CHH28_17380 [Bacterioplanes sanyensis]
MQLDINQTILILAPIIVGVLAMFMRLPSAIDAMLKVRAYKGTRESEALAKLSAQSPDISCYKGLYQEALLKEVFGKNADVTDSEVIDRFEMDLEAAKLYVEKKDELKLEMVAGEWRFVPNHLVFLGLRFTRSKVMKLRELMAYFAFFAILFVLTVWLSRDGAVLFEVIVAIIFMCACVFAEVKTLLALVDLIETRSSKSVADDLNGRLRHKDKSTITAS